MHTLLACLLLVLAPTTPVVQAAPPSVHERLERRARTCGLVVHEVELERAGVVE